MPQQERIAKHRRIRTFPAWIRVLGFSCALLWTDVPALDITEHLVDLGNKPAESGMRGHSLNPWDLQAYAGKIFIGMGSTVVDPGPIPVWAFDHAAGRWDESPEIMLEMEAIELFRVFEGDLYVPSSDPTRAGTDASKFYRRDANGDWTHILSVGLQTAHIRDLALHDGFLIGVGNSRRPHDLMRPRTGTVKVPLALTQAVQGGDHAIPGFSSAITLMPPVDGDGGVDVDTSQRNRSANWFFAAFHLHDGLYASTRWLSWAADYPERIGVHGPSAQVPPQVPPFPAIVRWDASLGEWVAPPPDAVHRLVPDSPDRDTQLTLRPFKPVLFGEWWVAPIRSYGLIPPAYRNAYNQSADFVVKPANGPGLRVVLPDADALGEAVLVHQNTLYVLANARQPNGEYRAYVYSLALEDARANRLDSTTGIALDAWQEVLTFSSSNLARSFARIDDSWYFGLGFAHRDRPRRAGTLLRFDQMRP